MNEAYHHFKKSVTLFLGWLCLCIFNLALAQDPQLQPSKSHAVELKPKVSGVANHSIDAEKLRGLLEPHGWRVESDGEGGVLLFPRARVVPSKAPSSAFPGQSVSPSITLGEGFTPAEVERLRVMLSPHGWRVESDGVGGVLLFPRAVETPKAPPSAPPGQGVAPSVPLGESFTPADVERLRAMLTPHGWRVESDGEGGLLLFPHAVETPKAPPSAFPGQGVAPSIPLGEGFTSEDVERLRAMLTPHGWRVESDDKGGVLLHPRAVDSPLPAQQGSIKSTSAELIPRTGFTPKDIDHLRRLLSPHGWRVESDGEGGVLLYPGAFEVHSAPRSASSGQAQTGITSIRGFEPGDLEILRSLLTPHGWRVEGDSRGGILLIPKPSVDPMPALPHVAASRWSGIVLPPIQEGSIRVPIDSWEKAHHLTRSWVELSGQRDLLPGKIRKINKVYLVSVVSKVPPHPLRHQLIFREDDGHMFLVY